MGSLKETNYSIGLVHILDIYVGNTIAAVIAELIFSPEMNVFDKISIDIMMTIGLSLVALET